VTRTALGPTKPPIQWITGSFSLGVKRPGREADHSPPSSAEVKNVWSYTNTPQYAFMAWCSVKAQGLVYLYQDTYIEPISAEFSYFQNSRLLNSYSHANMSAMCLNINGNHFLKIFSVTSSHGCLRFQVI
jgi:hypothetical protein